MLSSFAAFLVIIECLHLLVPRMDSVQYWPTGYVEDRAFVQSSHLRWMKGKETGSDEERKLYTLYDQKKKDLLERLRKVPKQYHQRDLWDISDPRRATLLYFNTDAEEEEAGDDIYVQRTGDVITAIEPELVLPTLE